MSLNFYTFGCNSAPGYLSRRVIYLMGDPGSGLETAVYPSSHPPPTHAVIMMEL